MIDNRRSSRVKEGGRCRKKGGTKKSGYTLAVEGWGTNSMSVGIGGIVKM